ncbi:MAG: tRNA preQ1(34) S-adenosylmethionine ribosyltransferase-isomerase QueA [Deltaproteobacteria bacterium]|nr:tRNA preQ1(34) S-adenosylmethionine ribosyltransferase-isomerase QueA [Deltaproteobacteria bacterium]
MYLLSDYDYNLPQELIAQKPCEQRDSSKLLYMDKKNGALADRFFFEIETFFKKGDILVINNTKVLPARLYGKKETGGKIEALILSFSAAPQALIKSSKRLKNGAYIFFDKVKAEVLSFNKGVYQIKFSSKQELESLLERQGQMPLPPYIQRYGKEDKTSYQTVYASKEGAVAAPTAGLHFTENLINRIKAVGVEIVEITLHVGYGTFFPVRVKDIREHQIHSEQVIITPAAADKINNAKKNGSRVIAVGTTSVRSLEFAASENGKIKPIQTECDLFIYPGYRFKIVNAIITNFHLPKSTLLMLVSAFAGRENILKAYEQAVNKRYRFFSYGDAMFLY